MFGSDILDIIIGMVFVFLLMSLICSSVNEFIESVFKNRARDLERGIGQLIGDPDNSSGFIDLIYNHGMVNSLFKGSYPPDSKGDLPSYIPAQNFAMTVVDIIQNPPPGIVIPPNVQTAVNTFIAKAPGDAAQLQANLEDWFNTGMDRVSGWYKRRTQWIILGLGLAIAIGLNADTVKIAQSLANDSSLRKGLVAAAQARAGQPLTDPNAATATQVQIKQYTDQLNSIGLPFGWREADLPPVPFPAAVAGQSWFEHTLLTAEALATLIVLLLYTHLFGWLITAAAISMGAPFWFDLLGKVISVRSTLKPDAGKPDADNT